MDEKFIFQIAKHNLENANSKISVLIKIIMQLLMIC